MIRILMLCCALLWGVAAQAADPAPSSSYAVGTWTPPGYSGPTTAYAPGDVLMIWNGSAYCVVGASTCPIPVTGGTGGGGSGATYPAVTAPPGTTTEIAATSLGTSSTTLVPATASSTTARFRAVLYNTSTTGTAWCRADGGTATVGTGVPLVPNYGGFEWDYPSAGTAAITCVASIGTLSISGEYVQ